MKYDVQSMTVLPVQQHHHCVCEESLKFLLHSYEEILLKYAKMVDDEKDLRNAKSANINQRRICGFKYFKIYSAAII